MNKPHKHAELIKAWADGAEIEFRWDCLDDWRRLTTPRWDQDGDYRIKPAPKPDFLDMFLQTVMWQGMCIKINGPKTPSNSPLMVRQANSKQRR